MKKTDSAPRRLPRRLPEALLILVVLCLVAALWAMNRPTESDGSAMAAAPASATPAAPSAPAPSETAPAPASASPAVATTAPTSAPSPEASYVSSMDPRSRLVGRWLRPDGGYILTVEGVGLDGKVTATYKNPNPIHVSRAEAVSKEGQTLLMVELRDRGYPGNYYTLRYDPAHDQLTGVYNHLGIGQTFDVNFTRLGKDDAAKQ